MVSLAIFSPELHLFMGGIHDQVGMQKHDFCSFHVSHFSASGFTLNEGLLIS